MRRHRKSIFGILLLVAVFLLQSRVPATELPRGEQSSGQEAYSEGLDLSDMIPKAVKLSGLLKDLEQDLKAVLDVSIVERKSTAIETNLKGLGDQLKQVKAMEDYRPITLVQLRQAIEQENNKLEAILEGGIAFATPEDGMGEQADQNAVFPLHPKVNDHWLKWRPRIMLED